MDQDTKRKIVKRVNDYLEEDPVCLGKTLKGIFKGLYRYRYGSYRIIYAINREDLTIMVLRAGDSKDVYDRERR